MSYLSSYKYWSKNTFFDKETRLELSKLNLEIDAKEIEDRFYCDLEFGTGGLRGVMGAGTNRINKYTIGRATSGLADYLLNKFTKDECLGRGVAIAYDTRNNSEDLAQVTSDVLTAKGIRVLLFKFPVPTPELSFTIKFLNCIAGIIITASHNPKEYNGYKVYDEFGCQLVPRKAKEVISFVNSITDFTTINFNGNRQLQMLIDTTNEFVDAVLKQSIYDDIKSKKNLKIVYTPLHGTGNIPVRMTLEKAGFSDVNVVTEQEKPDGNFSTVKSPNPEEKNALDLGIKLADEINADIVLGTDPDGDRIGVAVKTKEGFELLTGNQVGALLVDYVLSKINLKTIQNPAVINTVVTSELGALIARKNGVSVLSTLTGFKFIGEKITEFESGNHEQGYTFVLGYEESYGYLIGTHARDKDAVVSSLIISEMAAEYKTHGKTLYDRLGEIYSEFGYYRDALDSITLKGKDGLSKIQSIMSELRAGRVPLENLVEVIDYNNEVKAEKGFGELPKSNVLKFIFNDGSWLVARPSGTEPKIKFYYSIKGNDKQEAEEKFINYKSIVHKLLEL